MIETKPGDLSDLTLVMMGLDSHKIVNISLERVYTTNVRNYQVNFDLKLGILHWKTSEFDILCKSTLLLEIHYYNTEQAHAARLPLNGFGSNLHHYYAAAAHQIAQDFCKTDGYEIIKHTCSYPKFQAQLKKVE